MIPDAPNNFGIQSPSSFFKRAFDVVISGLALLVTWPLLVLLALAARLNTGASGIYRQNRIGLFGQPFTLYKLRSMKILENITTNVTTSDDERITSLGRFLRRTKLDELPQLWNVFKGDMSFVGPRPDVQDVYEGLTKADLRVLSVRPGITGPASLQFRNEEEMLNGIDDPEEFNRTIVFPQKVKLNLKYIDQHSFLGDIKYIWKTLF